MVRDYTAPRGYLTLSQAQKRLGVAKATVQRMTQDGRLRTYRDRRDQRVRLAKIEDVERLMQPPLGAPGMRSEEELRNLVEKARTLNARVPRVSITTELHAAGFAFGELRAWIAKGNVAKPISVETDPRLLRDIGRELYIAGSARAGVTAAAGTVRVTPGDDCRFSFVEGPDYPGWPPGSLWKVANNYGPIMLAIDHPTAEFATMLELLIGDAVLPWSLLATDRAKSVTGETISDHLFQYAATVSHMKEAFAMQLRACIGEEAGVVDIDWSPEWYPSVENTEGPLALGNAYRVFQTEGIDLINLKDLTISHVSMMAENWLMPRSEAQAIVASFGA